jgi:hypothetical protein
MDSLGILVTLNTRAEQHSAFGFRKKTSVLALLPPRLQEWARRDLNSAECYVQSVREMQSFVRALSRHYAINVN